MKLAHTGEVDYFKTQLKMKASVPAPKTRPYEGLTDNAKGYIAMHHKASISTGECCSHYSNVTHVIRLLYSLCFRLFFYTNWIKSFSVGC